MSKLKLLVVLVVLAAVGVAAYNYGRGEPLWADPFQKTLKQKAIEVGRDVKEAFERPGK